MLFQFLPKFSQCSVLISLFVIVVFFIRDSNLSSHPGFDFLFVVFKGTSILSQTTFALAYIKKFNSVMSFVGIFVNKSFTLSVSDLTYYYYIYYYYYYSHQFRWYYA